MEQTSGQVQPFNLIHYSLITRLHYFYVKDSVRPVGRISMVRPGTESDLKPFSVTNEL